MIGRVIFIGLASVCLVLFAAGVTYFGLSAALLGRLPIDSAARSTDTACTAGEVSGELIVIFSDELSEQTQNNVIQSYRGTVGSRSYSALQHHHTVIVQVEPGKEPVVAASLSQTAGVLSAAQNTRTCGVE